MWNCTCGQLMPRDIADARQPTNAQAGDQQHAQAGADDDACRVAGW